jgi:hypothetical protein
MQFADSLDRRRSHAAARDAALRRLKLVKRAVVVLTLALAAGFTVLAYGATPPAQKQRHSVVVAAATRPKASVTKPKRHHKRHRRRHRAAASAAAPSTSPSTSASAAPSAPAQSAPASAAPAQPQAPAAPPAPAPAPQPPAATSGGS